MIDASGEAQRAALAAHVEDWLRRDVGGDPRTGWDRNGVERGIRRCYAAAGLRWPGTVVWVASPVVGELTAQAAAASLETRRQAAAAAARPAWVRRGRALCSRLVRVAQSALFVLAGALFYAGMSVAVIGGIADSFAGNGEPVPPSWLAVAMLGGPVGAAFGCRAGLRHWRGMRADSLRRQRVRQLRSGIESINDVGERIRAAAVDPVRAAVDGAMTAGVRAQIAQPVDSVLIQTGPHFWYLSGADEVDHGRLLAAARREVSVAVGPHGALVAPPDRAEVLVGAGVRTRQLRGDGEVAALLWRRRHGGTTLPDDLWEGLEAFAEAGRVWWWPHPDFVIACEPPIELHLERDETGTLRPHRADGPAVRWRDGLRVHFLHGVQVPASLIAGSWDVETIHAHPNSEVRRVAIEQLGWLEYIRQARLRLVTSAPDPGNPPHELLLYEDPQGRLGDARVLVMTNGSPDRSGEIRRYAETVPAAIDDPVAAAAWQYGCPVETYRDLQRRT